MYATLLVIMDFLLKKSDSSDKRQNLERIESFACKRERGRVSKREEEGTKSICYKRYFVHNYLRDVERYIG